MSQIILINASPKSKDSASGAALAGLKNYLKQSEIVEYNFRKPQLPEEFKIENEAVLVFAFPLYVDGVPSHLVSCMVELEKRINENNSIRVYAISNAGFYEGMQNANALNIMENWCKRSHLHWQYGLGIGGGGMLSMLQKESGAKGPLKSVAAELQVLANAIGHEARKQENHFVNPDIPRLLYKAVAESGWRKMIKSNGGKRKDLFRKINI
jgi:hypothetical protein